MKDYTDEPDFGEFYAEHFDNVDTAMQSMYLQWKAMKHHNRTIEYYAAPTAVLEEDMPEGFSVDVEEVVDGAGFIVATVGDDLKARYVWRLMGDGTIDVAHEAKQFPAEPLDEEIVDLCREVVSLHYADNEVAVDPRMRDGFFATWTAIKDEDNEQEEKEETH